MIQACVRVAERNNRDINIRSLLYGLGVNTGVSDDQKTGLLELLRDLVGEGTGGKATSNALSTSVLGELKHGTLTIGSGRDAEHVGGVLNRNNDSGSKDNLLPSLLEVDNVKTIRATGPDVVLHLVVAVGGSNVNLGGKHFLHVLLSEQTVNFRLAKVRTKEHDHERSTYLSWRTGGREDILL